MDLEVKQGVAGRGVFAARRITEGEAFLRYSGPLLKHAQTTPQTLAVQIGPDLYLGESGGMDDFVNHSCEPNAGLRINGLDVVLVAIRDIEPGEEIFFDYSTTMDENDFEMLCHCGLPSCRKVIRDFKHLPVERQRYYATKGVVPEYNVKYVG